MTLSQKPGQVIILPKTDKRYSPGHIAKDNKGRYRGHPDTVTPKLFIVGTDRDYPTASNLNPPMIVSGELANHIRENI